MEYSVIVAGTGFEGREGRIRLAVRSGMDVKLVPEPNNPHDKNAIAVYVPLRRWYMERDHPRVSLLVKTDW